MLVSAKAEEKTRLFHHGYYGDAAANAVHFADTLPVLRYILNAPTASS
jgi:hypothetical protein